MADIKISALTALTGAGAAVGDLLPVVDISDTTMAASGTDKKITVAELLIGLAALPLAGGTVTGAITSTAVVNPLTTAAESWIGPSSTTGIYFLAGKVGIGTTVPDQLLQLIGASAPNGLEVCNTSGASRYRAHFTVDATQQAGIFDAYHYGTGAIKMIFNPNGGEVFIGANVGSSGAFNVYNSFKVIGDNGQSLNWKKLTELTTIAAAATTDTTIQMPATAIILAVNVRVTVAIPTATTFTVGDSGSAARFSTAAVAVAANSTDPGTKAGAYYNAGALSVRITPSATPAANTGRVRVTIFYLDSTPPTS